MTNQNDQNSFKDEEVNVFICYPRDFSGIADFFLDRKTINGKINFWLDKNLYSSEDWNQKIKNKILKSDACIVFLDKKSLYSDYIVEIELYNILKLNEKLRIYPYIQGEKQDHVINNFQNELDSLISIFSDTGAKNFKNNDQLIYIQQQLNIELSDAESISKKLTEDENSCVYIEGLKLLKDNLFGSYKDSQGHQRKTIQVSSLDFNPSENDLLKNEKAFSKICFDIFAPILDKYTKDKDEKEKNRKSIRFSEGKAYYFDEETALKIMETVADCDGGIYFNSQISLSDWFTDLLALNLSLQKEIEEIIDYRVFITKLLGQIDRPYPPLYTKTRIARVLFLPELSDDIKSWKNMPENDPDKRKQRYRDITSLDNIHQMMGATMAIVGYDQLYDMLHYRDEGELKCFFISDELDKLGINFTLDEQKKNQSRPQQVQGEIKQKERLKNLIIQQQVEPPFLNPAIDFAAFTHHTHRKKMENPNLYWSQNNSRNQNSYDDEADVNYPWPERPKIETLEHLDNIIDGEDICNGFELFRAGLAALPDDPNSGIKLNQLKFFLIKDDLVTGTNYEENSVFGETSPNLRLMKHSFLENEAGKNQFIRTLIKFTFLMDHRIFDRKETAVPSEDLRKLDSNTQIIGLNIGLIKNQKLNPQNHGLNELKKKYIYKCAKAPYNVIKIFNNSL